MPRFDFAAVEKAIAARRFLLLFLFLLAVLLVYPSAENNLFSYYALRVLGGGVILLSVLAISFRRGVFVLAFLLALPTLVQRLTIPTPNASTVAILSIVLSFVFDVLVVVIIFRHVFNRSRADSETIFGALCIYLLVGFSFASLYGFLDTFHPNAFYFDPHMNFRSTPNRFDFIYYSFGTLTSLGAPGITPVSPHARSLTVLEAIIGMLYLAVLIARLLGGYRADSGR